MDNINLLPDDLQKEEDKLSAVGSTPPPLNLYIPQDNQVQQLKPQMQPKPPVNMQPKKMVTEIQRSAPVFNTNSVKTEEPRSASLDAMDKEVLLKNQESKKNFSNFFSSKSKGKILKSEIDNSESGGTDKSFNVNLIPEGSDLFPTKKLYHYFIIRGVLALILAALVYTGLFILSYTFKQQDEILSQTLIQDEAKFQELEKSNNDLINSQKQSAQLEALFKTHIYWTKFFTVLEKITIPQVYYSGIKASLDGTITLAAKTDSYLSIARQYLAYQNSVDFIKSVNIANVTINTADGNIGFDVILEIKPEIFFNNPVKP